MNKVRLLALAAVSMIFCFEPAGATETKICGLSSGSSLTTIQDSINNAPGGLKNALNLLDSIPEIRSFLASAQPAKICATGIALGKNQGYVYPDYLIVIDIQSQSGNHLVTPLIFQTASIQGHHGVGIKPWLGFGRNDLASIVRDSLSRVKWQEAPGGEVSAEDALAGVLGQTSEPIDSLSPGFVLVPGVDAQWTTYLVSRLRIYGGSDYSTWQYLLDAGAVQVQEVSGRVRWGRVQDLFDRTKDMMSIQNNYASSLGYATESVRLETLRKLSE